MKALILTNINVTNLLVIGIILILAILVIIHLIRVYKKSPCGDCASAKQCNAFSKDKIKKAYLKACKEETKMKKEL